MSAWDPRTSNMPNPRDADPLTDAAVEQAAWDEGYERGIRDSLPPRATLLIVAIVSAIVAGLLVWSVTASAAPRSAATAIPAAAVGLAQSEPKETSASGNPSLPSGAPLAAEALPSPRAGLNGAPLPTQDPGEIGSAIVGGIAAYAVPSFGPRYLALPEGPGIRVRIRSQEHPERFVDRVSTDAGPDLAMQRAGRVADVSYADFAYMCGCRPEIVGLIRVTIEYGGPEVTPPATETEP